jgi:5'-3' exonuclease
MAAPLLIADVPWLLYRSFFALPKSIRDGDGAPVNALLGTVNTLLACEELLAPDGGARAVVACMGAEQATYRVALYPPYHAHRDPMPPELAHQWERAPALLKSLGWTFADTAELEADDVMFSYARAEQERGGQALLLTADRDLFGAVGERIEVLELQRGGAATRVGVEQVRARYGVDPEQVPDFIALRGDPSDGLPGAPGIGAKTAAELLRAHGTLEDLLRDARSPGGTGRDLRPRTRAALLENEQLLLAFKQIATLQRLRVRPPRDRATDYASGARVAAELGMRGLAERLRGLARA